MVKFEVHVVRVEVVLRGWEMAVVGGSPPHLEKCSKVAKALYKTRDHKPAAGSSWAGSSLTGTLGRSHPVSLVWDQNIKVLSTKAVRTRIEGLAVL